MRRTQEATLTELLSAAKARRGAPRRGRTLAARRAKARLALTLGVMSSCVGLGLLVGQLGRALLGG